ncbi:family 43 glycosylhydrolase [Terrabacter sp. MAHUQ-38]|uniref:family 43 glycosylhydrolase n=1 Tax=unclassified Terrabacter TaxID=2630222 RepID=UPI00165E4D06|nr:family 43 glycosylhydrolase [Terrabacter sp. MAHUQ-38]MBC9823795.1 family 43 glycosylhydrolase [Terrabacter sp. MAHUQ-38]
MSFPLSRRTLLGGGLGLAAGGLVLPALTRPALAASSGPVSDAQVYGAPTVSPLVWQRADPFVTLPVNGTYYFTGSVPEYDRIIVRGADTIAGLGSAAESVVWRRPSTGQTGGHIWAPELHRIDGRWYIYFAAGDAGNVFNIRMYVIESALADPRDPSGWSAPRQIITPWSSFALDSTTFEHLGRRYLVWAQSEPEIAVNTSLYIAEMASPFALATAPVRIATPTKSWETEGFKVNEGPAVLVRNGRVFITFSASATDSRYCMGLLTADARANLLDWRSWSKSPDPVFTTNEQTKQYGPGHNSFTVAEDGVTDVMVYHARDYKDIVGDPLYDPNRHARAQRLYWHPDGTPLFGVPVGVGGPIVRLSPADSATSFVRHFAYDLRVDADVRELADSQFRFVPGHSGDGTVSLQSVNFPDRFVRVTSTGLRIDPVEAGSSRYAAEASFRREPGLASPKGVSLQSVSAPGSYVRHDKGRLVVGSASGSKSTFFLG